MNTKSYLIEPVVDNIVEYVMKKVPKQEVIKEVHDGYSVLRFPLSSESDYDVNVCLYEMISNRETYIEGEVTAVPRNVELYGKGSFWYFPFEALKYKSSEQLVEHLKDSLLKILSNSTRIIQKKGFPFWRFICEFKTNTHWTELYAMGSLRFFVKVSGIDGNEKIYYGFPK